MLDPTHRIGGVVHTYQNYDPVQFPSPTQPPVDLISPAFEHLLMFGDQRPLTEDELARAVRLDPSQIAGLGPSLDALIALLLERKRKILATYETKTVLRQATRHYREMAQRIEAPKPWRSDFKELVSGEQLFQLERAWYRAERDHPAFARQLLPLMECLGDKYQVEQMAARYEFHGDKRLTVPEALRVKEELEKIDELLKQLEEVRKTARIGLIDMEALAEFTEPEDLAGLRSLERQIRETLRALAEQQGLQQEQGKFHLTPKAHRLFQGRLLEKIFSQLQASRSGRHQGPVVGDGAVEMTATKPYEFGDSFAQMDIPQTLINAMVRGGGERPIRLRSEDIEIHRTRNSPKCATVVIMDMSGSMRHDGQYINVKRMALAMEGLIRREYPGDRLHFIEMYSFAKPCQAGDIGRLMPKHVTIHDPYVRLKVDMSLQESSEYLVPPHFTNIQHSLQLARRLLAAQDTPNRQIILITDGLPTAHFEGSWLYLLYPPDPRTEAATLREGLLCGQEQIVLNLFLLPSWSQTEEDVRFAYRLTESTRGRLFFTAGRDLDRYVVWDYVQRKREIIA